MIHLTRILTFTIYVLEYYTVYSILEYNTVYNILLTMSTIYTSTYTIQ